MSSVYNLDRKSASKILDVSVRTLDRYIKAKKLSTRNVDGRVWLRRDEVEAYSRGGSVGGSQSDDNVSMSNVDKTVASEEVDNTVVISPDIHEEINGKDRSQSTNFDDVYKKILLDVKEELRERQERLELANYRVGQLEAQIRNSIPMLEYHLEKERTERKEKALKEEIEQAKKAINHVIIKESYQRKIKWLYLSIILAILALQPLWLILKS